MTNIESKCYAIVPAAGRSLRMGRAKLLLPWPTETMPEGLLIDKVLSEWSRSKVAEILVVLRSDDECLKLACERWPVTVVSPVDPPEDMKASVQAGLRYLQLHRQPTTVDRCFIAPADLPMLSSHCIDRMIETVSPPNHVMVPHFGERKGHPALLPWLVTNEIFDLGKDEGVNAVVDRHSQWLVEFPGDQAIDDIDTPEEYALALESATRLRL